MYVHAHNTLQNYNKNLTFPKYQPIINKINVSASCQPSRRHPLMLVSPFRAALLRTLHPSLSDFFVVTYSRFALFLRIPTRFFPEKPPFSAPQTVGMIS